MQAQGSVLTNKLREKANPGATRLYGGVSSLNYCRAVGYLTAASIVWCRLRQRDSPTLGRRQTSAVFQAAAEPGRITVFFSWAIEPAAHGAFT